MKVYFKGKNGELFPKIFPMSAIEMHDIIDRVDKVTEDDVLTFRIADYDNNGVPFRLCGMEFTADVYKLNVLAEKMKALDRNENAAFCALIKAYPLTRDGQEMAMLVKPKKSAVDSLIGMLKGTDISDIKDIREERLSKYSD